MHICNFFQEAHNALSPGTFKACQALHTYNGDQNSELQFGEGDMILILEEESPRLHWLVGCLDADRSKTGLVLVHFVRFLDKDEDQRVLRPITKCTAVHDYEIDLDNKDKGKKKADELYFKQGDMILILDQSYNRKLWMIGSLEEDRTKIGLVSNHFVQPLNKDEDQQFPRPKCIATNYYETTFNDVGELNLKKGDVILILDPNSLRQNWMMGCLEADRKKRGLVYLAISESIGVKQLEFSPLPKARSLALDHMQFNQSFCP